MLPCYVVCDVSCSMTTHVDELNAALRELRGAVHADPVFGARVRVCVVGFASRARVVQPLRPATEPAALLDVRPESGSHFGSVFTLLRSAIERDVRELKALRRRVSRPVLFFVSDGRPADCTWPSALEVLTAASWAARPSLTAFGVGAADLDTLGRISASRLFSGVRMGSALTASVLRPALLDDRV